MRIPAILGTRREAIKMAPVTRELEQRKGNFDVVVAVSAQRWGKISTYIPLVETWRAVSLQSLSVNLKQRILTNTSYQILGRVCQVAFSFTITYYLTRYLGRSGYGEYSLIVTYVIFFINFASCGFDRIAVREIAKDKQRAHDILANIVGMKLLLSVVAFLAAIVSVSFAGYPLFVKKGIWLYSLILLLFPLESVGFIFQVYLRTEFVSLSSFVQNALFFGLVVLAIRLGRGILTVVGAAVFSSMVANSILVGLSRRYIRLGVSVDFRRWKWLFIESIPLGLASLCVTVINRSGVIILSKFKGMGEVGIYAAPFRLVYFMTFIPVALMTSAFPLMSGYYGTDKQRFQLIFQKSVRYLFIFALPIALGGTFVAEKMVRFCFGSDFLASVPVLRILLWAFFLVSISIVPSYLLTSVGLQRINLMIALFSMVLSIPINLVLTRMFGAQGTAVTLLLIYAVICVANFYFVKKRLTVYPPLCAFTRPVIACMSIVLVVLLLRNASFIFVFCSSVVVYLICSLLLGGISLRDFGFLRSIPQDKSSE